MLLRPDAAITPLILYSLVVSAQRHGIQVHALCAMSTHIHLVVTDVNGVLPDFLHSFHRLVALGTSLLRGWDGPVWDKRPTSVVRLLTPEAVIEKIAYTLANPVAAGLVRYAHEWPGAKVRVDSLGRGMLYTRRPDVYFDPANKQWPAEVTMPITVPPTVKDAETYRHRVAAELQRLEWQARTELQAQGRGFLGPERATKVSPEERATSSEPVRELNPTFAVGRGNADIGKRAAGSTRAYRAAYRAALDQWRAGVRNVIFPAGTWWMRVFHGVRTVDECAVAA
jgi:hypothetical protein